MKQFLITRCIKVALLVLVCIIVGCDKDEPSDKLELSDKVEIINMYVSAETGTYKPAGSETTIECMLVKEEGELEYSNLPFGSIEGFDYVRGHEYELEVRKTTLANSPSGDSNITYTLLRIISDIPTGTPEPDELPEEAKFMLKMVELTPFMELGSQTAAPFDFLTFQILNHRGEYEFPYMPEFLQYYDTIIMSSPVLPDTFCIYSYDADEDGTGFQFSAQWSSYFYEKEDFPIYLKGYKDGKLIYEYSMTQVMRVRDFLGVDWANGRVELDDPENSYIYNILDTRHKFLLSEIQKRNNTSFVRIQVPVYPESTDEYLEEQEAGLRWLLQKHLGEKSSLTASDFRTLPEDAEVVETYENSTTIVAILHQNADDSHEECYYAVAEPK